MRRLDGQEGRHVCRGPAFVIATRSDYSRVPYL